ncbi:MAG TPA: S8 family peptidase, partial [Chthonomonadaceae bacterium]|nr:S8 family peptidase [Chthonomonadaceae bacterium]
MTTKHTTKTGAAGRIGRILPLAGLLGLLLCGAQNPGRTDALTAKSDLFLQQAMASHKAGDCSAILQLGAPLTAERERQLHALQAVSYKRLPLIHSVAARVPVRNLARLAALPFVQHLSADLTVTKCDEFTVGSSGASAAWQQYGLDGSGVTVAVVDSGIAADNLDLCVANGGASRVIGGVSLVSHQGYGNDSCGHGTHVAGIIAGNGAYSTGPSYFRTFYGIAPNADLVDVRVLDRQGQGSVSQVIGGIQWVIANAAVYNIRVLNLSLGHPVGDYYANDPLCQAVEQAWKAGIFVVCAAGNLGRMNPSKTSGQPNEGWGTAYGSIQSPGNDPYVITVGAMKSTDGSRADDQIATYSGRGPTRLDFILKPDIVAPGNQIISLEARHSYLDSTYGGSNLIPLSSYCYTNSARNSSRYFCLSGTSMSAPVV